MSGWSKHPRCARVRLVAKDDRGVTLVELMVAMLLTTILLGVVIAPLVTLTNVTGSTVSDSQATASARAAVQDMSAGVTSASQVCLPTQLTSTQTATPGAAVRIKTNVFGTVKWEQWWLNPSTNQLLAQTWTSTPPTPSSWRTVASNVSPASAPPTPPPAPFSITPTAGGISTTGSLVAGTYTATGATSDGNSDTGAWSYILHVYSPTAGTISQIEPSSRAVATTGSAAFTDQLAVAGSSGTVTYAKTGGSASLTITSNGKIATTGVLAAADYTVTGTNSDANGDTGTWAYTLHVYTPPAAGTIAQTSPTSGTVTTTGSATFTDQLAVTGNSGTVTYTQSTGNPGLTIFSLPATNVAEVLMIALTASSGTKATAVSVPLRSAITALDTVFTSGPGTCMVGIG
ncbi:MAG: PilW family protein [Acidimicrobiales bacterium]